MKIGVHILKGLSFSIKTCYKLVQNHPSILAWGHQDPPKVEDKLQRRYSRRTRVKKDDNVIEEKEIISVRTIGRKMIEDIKEEVEMTSGFQRSKDKPRGRRVTFSPVHDYGFINGTIKMDDQQNEIHGMNEIFTKDEKPLLHDVSIADEFHGAPKESNDCCEESEANQGKDGSKVVVSWTEDDEKNLMDLGCSEMERNKRLESLMARRRARKNMRNEVDKNHLDNFECNDAPYQIAPLSIIKNKTFMQPYIENKTYGMQPIPSSAPSVLIPRKNPFDLPYDPHEEKPNLTGDSFSQEIMTVLQKDIYCRHESFCFGSASLSRGLKQDKGDTRISAFFIPEDIQWRDTSDSIEEQEEEQKQVIEQEGELISNIDHSPSIIEKRTIDESLFCVDKGVVHNSFPSIASDMQVEVSEVGSPPLSAERTISLTDGECVQYNESVQSDISFGSEVHWTASSCLCAVDEIESKSREVNEICEYDVIKAGLLETDEPVVIEPRFELVRIDSNSNSYP